MTRPSLESIAINSTKLTVQSKCSTVSTSSIASYESDHSLLLQLASLKKSTLKLRKDLDSTKIDASRWKNAVHGDLRPGSHYRKEIALLKQELDKRDDVIQEREITIENFRVGNHLSHPIIIQHSDSQQTSVCSSLLDDAAESPQSREMERLLLENSAYVFQLQDQGEELNGLRREIADLKQKNATYVREADDMMGKIARLRSRETLNQREVEDNKRISASFDSPLFETEVTDSPKGNKDISIDIEDKNSTMPFDPFPESMTMPFGPFPESMTMPFDPFPENISKPSHLADQSSSQSDSKRIMDLHNELCKITKDKKKCRHELDLSQHEVEKLRTTLRNIRTQSKTTIFELERMKKKNEEKCLTAEGQIRDLEKALDQSLVELENSTKFMTEQSKSMEATKQESGVKEKQLVQFQYLLRVKTDDLETANKDLIKKAAKIEELGLFQSEYRRKISNEIKDAEKKIDIRDIEIERLQRQITLWGEKFLTFQKEFADKEATIKELELAKIEANGILHAERKTRVQLETDNTNNLNEIKGESDILLQKENCQKIQLQRMDQCVLENEIDKKKLEATVKDMHFVFERTKSENITMQVKNAKDKDCLRRKLLMKSDEIHRNKQTICEHDTMIVDLQASIEKLKLDLKKSRVDKSILVNDKTSVIECLDEMTRERNSLRQQLVLQVEVIESQNAKTYQIQQHLVGKDEEMTDTAASNMNSITASAEQAKLVKEKETKNRVEVVTAQKKDLQDKVDVLSSKIIQLRENIQNVELECDDLKKIVGFYANEILRLYDELVAQNCDIPLKQYVKKLLDIQASSRDDLVAEGKLIEELKRAKLEFVMKSNKLFEDFKVLDEKNSWLKKCPELKSSELLKLRKIKEQNQSLTNDMTSQIETLHVERQEKTEVGSQRDNLVAGSECLQHDLRKMRETNECLQKQITFQMVSLDRLSGEVSEKNGKIKTLEDDIIVRNDVSATNAELIKGNTYLAGKVSQLSLETQELNEKLCNQSDVNRALVSLKDKLAEAKKLEADKITSYERQISALTMNKDVTIDTLRKDLAASRHRSAEEIARLTNESSRLQSLNNDLESRCNQDSIRIKDQHIYALERTLFAQEKEVDSLQVELGQVKLSMRNVSEQRRKDLEELQTELMESKLNAMKQDRTCATLNAKLDECKIEYEDKIGNLTRDVKRLKKSSPILSAVKDLKESNMMLEAKEWLEQLKVVNIELKEDNIKLSTRLERALIKIHSIKTENAITVEMEKDCVNLRKQLNELESLLENNMRLNSGGDITINGKRTKYAGRDKTKIPSVLYIDTRETLEEETDSAGS